MRERHYISASNRHAVVKMTLRCGLGWRDRNGFYTLRSEKNGKEEEREREKVTIKKRKQERAN